VENKPSTSHEHGLLMGKMVHLALPVRWSLVGQESRGPMEVACTYDIHPRGARLLGGHEVSLGDLVMVERGHRKAVCQVVWTADRNSQLRGQFTVQCVEGRTPWDEELRQMEEEYQPVILGKPQSTATNRPQDNRRRRPRYEVEGKADVIDGVQCREGLVREMSEIGARITARDALRPGTDFRLMMNVFDVSLALKANVKYLVDNSAMGVEFQEMRRGDRPLLDYVLGKLRKAKHIEEFVPVEVVTEPLAASAG
jgi:hypothetical protein